jgi:hypothetical protein
MKIHSKVYYLFWNLYNHLITDPCQRIKWAWQRLMHGYDDTAYWDLAFYLAKIAAPVLRHMETVDGSPIDMNTDEWQSKLHKMRNAMGLIGKDNRWEWTKEDRKVVKDGLALFSKHFLDLWT